jgi:hypothetical protein
MRTTFSLSLTASQAPLIRAIKDKLDSYMLSNNEQFNLPASSYENILKIVGVYSRDSRGGKAKPTISISVSQIKFIMETLIPALSSLNFVTKKYSDFLDWAFISYLINTGKHTTEAGKTLIIKLSQRINSKSLTSYKGGVLAKEISSSELDKVINMKDVYIKGKDGLRILANDPAKTVSGQLFYILAIGSNGEILKFSNSKECAYYFQVTSATINNRIVKKMSISNPENVSFTLSRKII